jgi:hypothetical protein
MYELKTNTATRIAVGPLVDPTDGKTAEVALTVTGLSVEIFSGPRRICAHGLGRQ